MKPQPKAPPYCQGFKDRHGKQRWYYRRRGYPLHALPGTPWSPEFMDAYARAVRGEGTGTPSRKLAPEQRTISALVVSYYKTYDFKKLRDTTKVDYRNILERFRMAHGDKRADHLQHRHVQKIITDRADTPAAANKLLRMLHLLMRHAIELGWRIDDPTEKVRRIKHQSGGFTTWEDEHIEAFEAHHKPGSRAHLALALLIYTGQRRSDVVRMGHQHVRDGCLSITQQKTGQRVDIPLHPKLRVILDTLPATDPAFLMTVQGRPFTPASFTNWFREVVKEAGLPDGLSAHGLRKATCRRLAEAGCTPHQIMAISGHRSLSEVTRYTVAAGRKALAAQAMLALQR